MNIKIRRNGSVQRNTTKGEGTRKKGEKKVWRREREGS